MLSTFFQYNEAPKQIAKKPLAIGDYTYNSSKLLGEGAFGKVYEGQNVKNKQKVAIKIINLKQLPKDSYYRSQLSNEINSLKAVNHPNIMRLYEVITKKDNCFIITEFCEQGNLKEKISHCTLNETTALNIYSQLLNGFHSLLNKNIIHRDLKPANILFQNNYCKLADFGFSRFVDNFNNSLLKSCVGTPLYMAPQILMRHRYTTKCDIWSLGVILYEMLFGRVPWIGLDEKDLLNNILKKPLAFKPKIKISSFSEEILKRSLVVSEDARISWDELFSMFAFKEFKDGKIENLLEKTANSRQMAGILHYISLELYNNYKNIKSFQNISEDCLEILIIGLSFYVKKIMRSLQVNVENIREIKKDNSFCTQHLNNLINILKKEMSFYSNFHEDIIKFFSENQILMNLTKEALEIFGEKSDANADIENIENIIISNGSKVINESIFFFEKNVSDKNKNHFNLECLRCIDYLMDCISIIKKSEKPLNFQNLLMEKNQNDDEELYMRNLLLKKNKIF